jgi:chorismate mutase
MPVRGIRGAITVDENTPQAVLLATRELLNTTQNINPTLLSEDIASIIFTVTADLNCIYPAQAAREMGWDLVPLMCALEIPVPGSLPKCIRLLIHWNTPLEQNQVNHVYLRDAVKLRPDLSKTKRL